MKVDTINHIWQLTKTWIISFNWGPVRLLLQFSRLIILSRTINLKNTKNSLGFSLSPGCSLEASTINRNFCWNSTKIRFIYCISFFRPYKFSSQAAERLWKPYVRDKLAALLSSSLTSRIYIRLQLALDLARISVWIGKKGSKFTCLYSWLLSVSDINQTLELKCRELRPIIDSTKLSNRNRSALTISMSWTIIFIDDQLTRK